MENRAEGTQRVPCHSVSCAPGPSPIVRTSTPAAPRRSTGDVAASGLCCRASAVAVSRTSPRSCRNRCSFSATSRSSSASSAAGPATRSCRTPVVGLEPVFTRVWSSSCCNCSQYCSKPRRRFRNNWFSQRSSATSSSSSAGSMRPLAVASALAASDAFTAASSRSVSSTRATRSSCSLSTAGMFLFSSSSSASCSRKPSEPDSRPSRCKSRISNLRLSRSICNVSRCLLKASV
mmetsp:Transcript_57289/g.158605  ORF Transcript_57289/g.158605 Transcript_57289/m.158605 type:complete len:234 (+) Transcript_57289:121-822(+)